MKKYLILICLLALLPSNALAIARVDEAGKTIIAEPKDGEYSTMIAPEQDGNTSSTDPVTPEGKAILENEKATSSDDLIGNSPNGNYQDDIYTTTIQEDAELYDDNETKDEDNILLIVISSVLGLSIGSVGTYLFLIKRK